MSYSLTRSSSAVIARASSSRPFGATTAPAAPFTSAGSANLERRPKTSISRATASAPWAAASCFSSGTPAPTHTPTTSAARPVAYLHLRGPAAGAPDFDAIARYRKLFDGALIANHGFDRETGDAIVDAGVADAVSYARLFTANPDLVSRFALGHEPATGDRNTHYSGGAHGYTDYPIWPAR